MDKIDIKINQAKLLSYQVELNDEKPEIHATIGLYAGEKQISTFSLTTKSYYSGIRFELPPDVVMPIVEIAKQLQVITIRECSKALAELPTPRSGLQ